MLDKFYYNNWNVGVIEQDINSILFDNNPHYKINWIQHNYRDRFFADPFVYSVDKDEIKILVEEFLYTDKVGHISLLTIDRHTWRLLSIDVIIKQPFHMSYPFLILDDYGCDCLIPEASMSGLLCCYNISLSTGRPINQRPIIPEPLCDSTIIYYKNKYYLFATKRGLDSNSKLYIYYSDKITGPYVAHKKNPVVCDSALARPAGNMYMTEDGSLFRLTQKNDKYYGETVNLTRIDILDEENFEETLVKRFPKHTGKYKDGFHTLNGKDGICVVDGFYREFSPLRKVVYEMMNLVNQKKTQGKWF